MPLKLIPPGQRKNNPYYLIRGTHEARGQSFERSTGTRNAVIARNALDELNRKLDNEVLYGREVTFAEAALAYMEDGGERRFMVPILRHFGEDTLIRQIDAETIRSAARALYPNATDQTRHRQAVTPIRAVLNHHERGGRRQPRPDNQRLRWLSPEEAEQLIVTAEDTDPRTARMILYLLGTGCRPVEMLALHADNLHTRTAQVFIAKSKINEARMIPIEAQRALPALLKNCPASGAVFRTPKGQPYKIVKNRGGQFAGAFNKVRDAAGLDEDVTPYTLRHTWATWYYAATGHDLTRLMAHGGWKKADTAMRYSKLAPADLVHRLSAHGWHFSNWGKSGESETSNRFYSV